MSFQQVQFDEVSPQPWKNGGGVTRELLVWPRSDCWLMRISVADIEMAGPFSSFPGVTRSIAVLNGAGIRLGDPLNVELHAADRVFSFAGAGAPHCDLLQGPTRDLNAMFNDDQGAGSLRQWPEEPEPSGEWTRIEFGITPPSVYGVFTLANAVLRTEHDRLQLPPMSLAWTTAPTRDIEVFASSRVWAFHYTLSAH
jgi:uncharacterized protein